MEETCFRKPLSNPVSKVLKIVVYSEMDADATVQVTDIIGKVVNDSNGFQYNRDRHERAEQWYLYH